MELKNSEDVGLALFNRRKRMFQDDRCGEELADGVSQSLTPIPFVEREEEVGILNKRDVGLEMFELRRHHLDAAEYQEEPVAVVNHIKNEIIPIVERKNLVDIPVSKPDLGLDMFNRRKKIVETAEVQEE